MEKLKEAVIDGCDIHSFLSLESLNEFGKLKNLKIYETVDNLKPNCSDSASNQELISKEEENSDFLRKLDDKPFYCDETDSELDDNSSAVWQSNQLTTLNNRSLRYSTRLRSGLPKCGKEYCRLGCICDNQSQNNSNNNRNVSISNKNRVVKQNQNSSHNNSSNNSNSQHCGRYECMFECSCSRRLRSTTRLLQQQTDPNIDSKKSSDKKDKIDNNNNKNSSNLNKSLNKNVIKNKTPCLRKSKRLNTSSSSSTNSDYYYYSMTNSKEDKNQKKENRPIAKKSTRLNDILNKFRSNSTTSNNNNNNSVNSKSRATTRSKSKPADSKSKNELNKLEKEKR